MFSGHGSVRGDIEQLVHQSGSGDYLANAILCLGAMAAINQQAKKPTSIENCHQFAMESYSNSISGLRHALNTQSVNQNTTTVLWTTLLLGLFEVSNIHYTITEPTLTLLSSC